MSRTEKSGVIKLKEKEGLPKKTLSSLPFLAIEMSPQGKILTVSEAVHNLTGFKVSDLLDKDFAKIFQKEGSPNIKGFLRSLKSKDAYNYELELKTKAGDLFVVSFSTSNVYDKKGTLRRIVAFGKDITKIRRMEGRLRRSEELYRVLIENQGEGFTIVDSEERFVYANPAAEEIFGVPPRGLVGRNLGEFTSKEQFAAIRGQTQRRRKGERGNYECEIIQPKGERRCILVTTTPWISGKGGFEGAAGVFRDITSWKKVEEALRISEEKYRLLFENVADVIFTMDKDFRIVTISPSVETATGYKAKDIAGRRIYELPMVSGEYLENARSKVSRVFKGETLYQSIYKVTLKDGGVKVFSVTTSPLKKGDEIIGSLSVCRDVTREDQE